MLHVQRASVNTLHYLMEHFPCVAVLGARQVGKTTLLKQILPDSPLFDLERQADYELIAGDPDLFLSRHKNPVIIDEAQRLPRLFPALRVAIDNQRHTNGRFLLSGSSSPELTDHINESLAGRIAIFELSGLTLNEAHQTGFSPLYKLLANRDVEGINNLKTRYTTDQLLESCLLGSYPEPFLKYRTEKTAFTLWMENYIQSYINRDIRSLFPGLNIIAYRRFIGMLAAASGQILNASEFARSLEVSQPTARSYFHLAAGTFVWRMLPAFDKNITKRTIKMPRGHMRDTGLLNYQLRNTTTDQLQSHPLFGRIWEAFIIEEILKGFANNLIPVQPYFYRTARGAEIDLILEGSFGILPIEIKSGSYTPRRQIQPLIQFVAEHELPLGVLINNAASPALITPNIIQIPAGCL
jgi:predicted AAA+ superfamily ATPase